MVGRISPEVSNAALGMMGEVALVALVLTTYRTATCADDYMTAFAVANMLTWGAPIWIPILTYCYIQDGVKVIRMKQEQDRMIAQSLLRKQLRGA